MTPDGKTDDRMRLEEIPPTFRRAFDYLLLLLISLIVVESCVGAVHFPLDLIYLSFALLVIGVVGFSPELLEEIRYEGESSERDGR